MKKENRSAIYSSLQNKSHMSVFDDEIDIFPLELACKPETFGYSPEEADIFFPNISYPKCEDQYDFKTDMFWIDRKTDTLHMNCDGLYILGQQTENLQKLIFENPISEYTGPVKLSTQEYAFGTCDKNTTTNFEYVDYKLKLNKSALDRAQKSMKETKLNVVMLVIDSMSRRNFFRKLPRSIGFLNSLSRNISVFDFKMHHVMGQNSPASFMPTLYGDFKFKIRSKPTAGDLYYDRSIWKYLHHRGFVSLIGFDHCGDIYAKCIGNNPQVDHLMTSF